ncbi:fimbrial protein [Pasteurellaceae bacterium LFhippo2]|nr:fimbrial protein [Pasteurellaceae bacterium LFhippo2]
MRNQPKIYEYHWKALNRFQQKQRGKCLAQDTLSLEKQLLNQGYSHIKISRNFVIPQNPKQQEITQFIEQLALLINASIPLKQALAMILENCQNIRLYQWIFSIIALIESGFSFSDAISKEQKYLQAQEIQLIKMGETSGTLATVLTNIAITRSKSEKLAKKVKKILAYPIIVLFISISLSIMLLLFIVPQFADLYSAKDQSLPFITDILFRLSHFLQNQIKAILFVLFLVGIMLTILARKAKIIANLKFILLSKLPVFNQIIHHSRIVFFSQNCALMLNSHIRLDLILNSFIETKQIDTLLQKEATFCLNQLKQGYRFSDGLNPSVFGYDVIQMISIGEQSGNLAKMLEHISDIYQQKLDYQVDMLSQLLEPALMLIMGIIVGTIMVGLYLPIFDMGGMVG